MLSLKKIWELVQGTTLDDAHEIPVSEGVGAGKTKKYNIGQLKGFISSFILDQISGITKGDQGPQGATGAQGIQGEKGEKGDKGDRGDQGLKGDQGLQGPIGIQGPIGVKGDKGDTGAQGVQGIKGDKGDKGDQGDAGLNGDNGNDGISAYEVALNNGFVGTEEEWLESLVGPQGDTGAPGVGVPTGGTAGQVLQKVDGTDFNTLWVDPPANNTKGRFEIGYACSDENTNLVADTSKIKDKAPYAFRLTSVQANVNIAPTGASIIINIKKNGVTIFNLKPRIDVNKTTTLTADIPYQFTAPFIDWALGDNIQIDLDQVGMLTPGTGLKVKLLGYIL